MYAWESSTLRHRHLAAFPVGVLSVTALVVLAVAFLPATQDFRFIGAITLWTLLWPSVVLWSYFTPRPRRVLAVLAVVAFVCLALVFLFAELTLPSPPAS